MRAGSHRSACAIVIGLVLVPASARAEPTPSDRALATQLFQEGRALVKQKKYAEACPKLEESQRLDPGGGTLLNLALCHEAMGRTATAWAELSEAVSVARRDRRTDREKIASEHMKALEPRLSMLTLAVDVANAPKDLVLRRDGTDVAAVAWSTPMPVDPGSHVVEASAPGFEPWSQTIELGPDADQKTITVPRLVALPEPEPEPPAAPPPPPQPTSAPAPAPLPPAPPPAAEPPPSRVPAYVALGVGVAGVAAGSFFGLRAFSKRSDSDAACKPRCTDQAVSLNDQAKTAADLSTIAFAVGAVGLGLGAYFWLDSTPGGPTRAGLLDLRGRW